MNKDKFLVKDGNRAEWGVPEGYPYKEQSRTEFAVLGEVKFTDNGYGIIQAQAFVNEKLVAGEKYAVVLDGEEYVVTAYEVIQSSMTLPVIGNEGPLDGGVFDENGPPFAFMTMKASGQVGLLMALNSGAGIHTVEIYKLSEIIHPMSAEFLPTETWTFTLEDGSTVTKKVAVGE